MPPLRIAVLALFAFTVLTLVMAAPAYAQTPAPAPAAPPQPPPCAAPEFRQFDFWIGDWDLVSLTPGAGKDRWDTVPGTPTDHVEVMLAGCALLQRWDDAPDAPPSNGPPLHGLSVSKWDPALKKWRQVWVDNQGSWLVFTGEWKNGRMELYTEPKETKGKSVVMRQVFADITPDTMKWSWERSEDGGHSYVPVWKLDYKRRVPAKT